MTLLLIGIHASDQRLNPTHNVFVSETNLSLSLSLSLSLTHPLSLKHTQARLLCVILSYLSLLIKGFGMTVETLVANVLMYILICRIKN